jgi:hypothetical protein
MRNLRTIINYFTHVVKIIPKEHEFARDVWVMLYRFNGANFADLLRMKWSQIKKTRQVIRQVL